MEEIKKPNDMFAAILQTPDLTLFDLAKSNVLPENTQLLDKDFYKNNDIVKKMFTDEKGKFNDLAFENAYTKAAQTYSEIGNDEQLVKALEWDPLDFTAPLSGRHVDIRPVITKDINPYKSLYSRTGINSIDVGDLSLRELAQTGKIYDPETNTWENKSANELSFFDKVFGDTLVYAQYDEDTTEINQLTGQTIVHKKGDWKFDKDGNLYIEKLGKREIHQKQIVNPMDLLTVDGSAFNKLDFFDSDGKTKSIAGTAAKLVVEIAPFLIPQTQAFYGMYKMAMGLSFVLPTFYSSIEGIFLGDNNAGNETPLWKAMNATQGYLAKYNQRSISDEASGGLFNYEQLANLVADVYSQIYEQRAAASLSKYFYKARDAEYIENLKKPVQEQLAKLDFADQIQGIKRTDEAYERIARAAAGKISELDDITKKRSALAKGLNLSYMAMTQSAQVYSDALAGGYDRRTAGAATLMSAAGQFALMSNNPLGTWFLDKTVGYTNEKAGMVAAYNNLIKDKLPKIQEGIEALAVNKKVGKNLIGTAFKDVKNGIKNYIGSAGLSTGTGNNIVRNAVVEGIEEVSEQAVMDASKGVIDFLSYLGFGGTQGSFGGFENVFSPTGLQNYLANFVGGVIGGSLFELERSVITPILSGNGVPKETQLGVIDYISNGKTKEFLDIAKEQSKKFGSNTLSPLPTDVNGEKVFLESKDLTQGDFIYQAVENYVNNIDKILNSENIKQDNESWVKKAIVDEIKAQDMINTNTDTFILSDIRELVDQIVTLKATIEIAEKNGEDTSKLAADLNEKKKLLDEIQLGKKADYYYGLSLFALNKFLHAPFLSLNIHDYVKNTYNQDFETLTKLDQDKYSAEFKAIMENDGQFKERMKAMYAEFLKQNETFSPTLEQYGANGYNVLREVTLKALLNDRDLISGAVKSEDFETLKQIWTNIHTLNTKLAEKGLNNLELNSSIGISLGKFLLNTGVVSVGLSKGEMAKLLNVEVADLDLNLQAQAILNRFEAQGKDLSIMTVSDLLKVISDPATTLLLEEEGEILLNSIVKEYAQVESKVKTLVENGEEVSVELSNKLQTLGSVTLKELYKPEVFNDISTATLSDEELEELADLLNSVIPTIDTIEADNIEFILNSLDKINKDSILGTQKVISETEPTDVEAIARHTESLNKMQNRKSLRIHTKKEILNKGAFINANIEKFYDHLISFLSTDKFFIGENKSSEVITNWKTEGLTNKQILNNIVSTIGNTLSISGEVENVWDFLIGNLSSLAFDSTTYENKEFSELISSLAEALKNDKARITGDIIEKLKDIDKEINEQAEKISKEGGLEFAEVKQTIINDLIEEKLSNQLAFDRFIIALTEIENDPITILENTNFTPLTNNIVRNTKQLVNNVMGRYLLHSDIYNALDNEFFSPTAQLLISFAKPIMKEGAKMDNEVIEAAKIELQKLSTPGIGALQEHRIITAEKLNQIINYGNVQKNTLLDKLRELQLSLYRESPISKSAFDLIKELNTQFAFSPSPATFKIEADTKEFLDKALYTLTVANAIIKAMTYTNTATDVAVPITYNTLYGYNVNFNKMYAKSGVSTTLGVLKSEDVVLLEKELSLIADKLNHFKLLAQNNAGSTIEEQGKIKKVLLDALEKRISDSNDTLSLLKLSYSGRTLITVDDLEKAKDLEQEAKINYLENAARNNFAAMVKESGNMEQVLDELFKPFKEAAYKHNEQYTLLDNRDSVLTETMTSLEVKDWYMYAHSILAISSTDFYDLYKKYLEKEVSLSDDFRAPFFAQQFIMRQLAGYINGKNGKKIMSHAVSFIVPEVDESITETDAEKFRDKFLANMYKAKGLPISWLYFVRGTSGTGKTDVLSNFILWTLTKGNTELLGNKLNITVLGPTEKTKEDLKKKVKRDVTVGIESNTVEEFIESLFSDERYTNIVNAVKDTKPLEKEKRDKGIEIEFANGQSTGVFFVDDTVMLSKNALDLLFKDIENEEPKVIIIDEASKINSLQYQILNYLAKNKNYYIIVLGDDLQEGTSIGPAVSSLENIYMPSSVKLKSTIRAENIHVNNNSIALENFADQVRTIKFFSRGKKTNPIRVTLSYALDNKGILNGTKFIDNLTADELRTLDPNKEIMFITDDGNLTADQSKVIKDAFGEKYLATATVSKPDVQGQEFSQVVVLSSLGIIEPNEIIDLPEAKHIYTILTRAKEATLVVGAHKSTKDNFTLEFKNFTINRPLNKEDIKSFLTERNKEVEDIINSLKKLNTPVETIENVEVPETEEEIKEIAIIEEQDLAEVEKEDLQIFEEAERTPEVKIVEIKKEVEKVKIDVEDTEDLLTSTVKTTTPKDVKIIGYSGHYNLGADLPEGIEDTIQDLPEEEITNIIHSWINNNAGKEVTDFAAYANLLKGELLSLSGLDLLTRFKGLLSEFLFVRNEIVSSVYKGANNTSGNNTVNVRGFINSSFNINLETDAYIRTTKDGEYSQLYGQVINNVTLNGTQFFLTIDVEGIPVTLMALSAETTATNKTKNTKGNTDKLKTIYADLKKEKKTQINLVNNLMLLTGVKTKLDDKKPTQIKATRSSLENTFKGFKVKEFGVFRGPAYDDSGNLVEVKEFMESLEEELNKYNKTPIKVVDNKKKLKHKKSIEEKGQEAYQRYMYRPFVIMSSAQDDKFKKLVLLYPKNRSLKEFWTELSNLDPHSEEDKIRRQSFISKYQAWKVVEEFIAKTAEEQIANYDDVVTFLSEAFAFTAAAFDSKYLGRDMELATTLKKAFLLWDKKVPFTDFVNSNTVIQRIFKGREHSFNPLFYLNSYINKVAEQNELANSFEEFIKNSNTKIYYNTRIKPIGLTSTYGRMFGDFDERDAENYFVGYYIETPDLLVDLNGITSKAVNIVKPVVTPKQKTDKNTGEELKILANGNFGAYRDGELITSINLANYKNINRILKSNSTEMDNFKNYLSFTVQNYLWENLGFRNNESAESLSLEERAEMDQYIKGQLKNRDNSIGELGTTASFKIAAEAKYCKI